MGYSSNCDVFPGWKMSNFEIFKNSKCGRGLIMNLKVAYNCKKCNFRPPFLHGSQDPIAESNMNP